jgi:hypothetical protein
MTPNSAKPLAALREHLHRSRTHVAPVGALIAETYLLIGSQRSTAKARVWSLLESQAFADAALAVLELGFPQWKLRRLIYDGDEWHCSLSQRLSIPLELDDMIEASHPILALAIICAVLEAYRKNLDVRELSMRSVPRIHLAQGQPICCDNFR